MRICRILGEHTLSALLRSWRHSKGHPGLRSRVLHFPVFFGCRCAVQKNMSFHATIDGRTRRNTVDEAEQCIRAPSQALFCRTLVALGCLPTFDWRNVITPRGWKAHLVKALAISTWIYSCTVLALLIAAWIRVLAFQGYEHSPVENIAYGCLYILPIVALLRGWITYGWNREHERLLWDLVEQENAELNTLDAQQTLATTEALAACSGHIDASRASSVASAADATSSGDRSGDMGNALNPVDIPALRRVRSLSEAPGVHHDRKRFLSLSWAAIDHRHGRINILAIALCWLLINWHLFHPLFTGMPPHEIDWLAQVAPDVNDRYLMQASVSGYAFALIIASFYQVGIIFTMQTVQLWGASLITLRAERLYKRLKAARRSVPAVRTMWISYVTEWKQKLIEDTSMLIFAPFSYWWLAFHISFTMLFSLLFAILLLYNGGSSPSLAIFITTSWQLGFLGLYTMNNDKRRAMLRYVEIELGKTRAASHAGSSDQTNETNAPSNNIAANEAGELYDTQATEAIELDPQPISRPSSVATAYERSTNTAIDEPVIPTSPLTPSSSALLTTKDADTVSPRDRRASRVLGAQFGVRTPSALIRALLPRLLLHSAALGSCWLAIIMIQVGLSYPTCAYDPDSSSFLKYRYDGCSNADYYASSIDSAFISWVSVLVQTV